MAIIFFSEIGLRRLMARLSLYYEKGKTEDKL